MQCAAVLKVCAYLGGPIDALKVLVRGLGAGAGVSRHVPAQQTNILVSAAGQGARVSRQALLSLSMASCT